MLMEMLEVLHQLRVSFSFVMDEPVTCARVCACMRAELQVWPSVGNSESPPQ